MPYINYISKSDIFFSCTEKDHRGNENAVAEHSLVHIYSGSMTVTDINGAYTISKGETVLFYRNMLAKFIKHPSDTTEFKSISIVFSQPFLQKYYSLNKPGKNIFPKWKVERVDTHPLLSSLFDSILPYYELHGNQLPEHLTKIKLEEAVTILREVSINVDNILANFSEQGKIDLADFMQKSYSFNIPLERFAYLTGRSLATFKRDFQKIFNTSPQKWLLQTRLRQAYFLISEKGKKPSDVYLEVGFENLSHFSNAFKQQFGYPPSKTMSY